MKTLLPTIIALLLSFQSVAAQNISIGYDYVSSSRLKDNDDNNYGTGDLSILTASFNKTLSMKFNERRQPTIWIASINAQYGIMNNDGLALSYNPDHIINAGVNFTHIRPIGKKWNVVATIGAGIYAPDDEIRLKSILVNGGVVFIYNLHPTLKLGIGGGLTNSFGAPMVLPMIYVSWERKGKFQFNIELLRELKISASTMLSPKFKLELAAFEMDGISAVMKIDNESKIYSSTMLKSYLGASYQFDKHFSISISAGVDWLRTAQIRDRDIKELFDFSDKSDRHFNPAFRGTAGVKYTF